MAIKIIEVIHLEGYRSTVAWDNEKREVFFTADADIDADGANGQNGKQAAYMVQDKGSEFLANGGMKAVGKDVRGNSNWFQDIVICDADGQPKIFPGGIIASKTAYIYKGKSKNDPAAYVDSETVPYVVVPPEIRKANVGVVMGCLVKCTNIQNGRIAWGMLADIGPRHKNGEVSIEMARLLGLPSSPRNGGTDKAIIHYTLFPDKKFQDLPLIRANGEYVG